jgi:hypothetical protein
MSTKAGEMWDAEMAFERLKSDMDDALMIACGLNPTDYGNWPFSEITYDDYDCSFEFKGVNGDWCPTEAQLAACWALGFSRCWICYDNLDGDGVRERTIGTNEDGTPTIQRYRERYFAAPQLDRVFPGEPDTPPGAPS